MTIVSNLWCLREVRKSLGLSPSSAVYRGLLLPVFTALVVVLALRIVFRNFQPAWVIILAALVSGYVVFVLNVIALGLKDDDRVLARIIARVSPRSRDASVEKQPTSGIEKKCVTRGFGAQALCLRAIDIR